MTLAELSLRRPVTAIMFFVSMFAIGLIAAFRLPLEQFPSIDAPFLFVQVPYPGSTPAEIERTITRPIEEALATLPGIKRMQSSSAAESAQVFLEFKWGEPIAIKAVQARERIDAIRAELPSDLQRYFVQKFSTADQPVLQLRIASRGADLANAWELIDREIKRPLERIPGVASVEISGIGKPEVQIELSADRLAAHHIALNELYQRLQAANFSLSAGQIDAAGRRLRVEPQGQWRSLDDIRAVPVDASGLKLGDIASVSLRPARVEFARRLDGKPAVGIDIRRERNANLVDIGSAVMARVRQIQTSPELAGIQVYAMENQADNVTGALSQLGRAGLEGTLLSVLVLFFFLRDWASTLMVSLAIPICFVITLGCMHFLGISLNVLSMMGLLLAVGMLVDNAVVVVESIYQYREKFPERPWYSAVQGTQVVGVAIAAGTLSSVIVFLPNIFGEANNISIFLAQVAITMSIAHLASWLVAVSLVPMLASRLPAPRFLGRDSVITRLRTRYGRIIEWTLCHRRWTMFALVAMSVLSLLPMTRTRYDMFDDGQSRQLQLFYQLNANYRLADLKPAIVKVEKYLDENRARFQIASVYSWYSEQGQAVTRILLTAPQPGLGQWLAELVGRGSTRPAAQIKEDIRAGLPRLAIGQIGFDGNGDGGLSGGVDIALVGDSMQTLRELSGSVVGVLSHLPSLRDVRPDQGNGDREMQARVDRDRARRYGFDAQTVASFIQIALRGMPLRDFHADDRQLPVWLRFQGSDTRSMDGLSDFTLRASDGSQVPLLAMLRTDSQATPSAIQRQDRMTAFKIVANLADGKTMNDARADIRKALDALAWPPGYRWSFGQGFDRADQAGNQMLFNTLIALLLVYVVMCAMFESLIYPAAILTTFVFSVFGVFWLFWLTDTTFSLMAAIGILILMGVVVNNGIVMIVHINTLRHEGHSRSEALVLGAQERLRPVLMTMATAILGMLPLALGGAQAWSNGPPYYPMARAIAGGLTFSTIVTLLALPCIYALLDDARQWTRATVAAARQGPRGARIAAGGPLAPAASAPGGAMHNG
ncbi:MAG: efflux RND transporter permease subunit [Dokdonella sp.]|uniref:efflux RND transporter permease subunit n=2 Tax=Dokdonella sp. TaxID=2291710 RepID=UPI0025C4D3A7|nr:efflux RND transporter permease subunit [Dokdonella sp.]MBX3700816.1 efflux RND transporter permease subunit [Dokdonella sp.]